MKTLGQSNRGDRGQKGVVRPAAGAAQETFGDGHGRLRLAIQASGVGLWDWDLATNQVYFSPECKRQLGYEDAEPASHFREWEGLLHPEDRERVTQGVWAYLADPGQGYEAEYRLRRKDGTYRWMLARAEVICDAAGRPCRMLGCQLDITERKAAEGARAWLAAIVESSEDAIISKSLEGIVTSWNEGARHLFGYTAEEMVGQPIVRLIPAGRLEEEVQILARLRRGERVERFETVRRRKDGALVEVSLNIWPIRDGRGWVVGVSKIARDISERKKTEQALHESHARFAGIVDSAMDAIITIDETQRVVLFNAAAERVFGCPAAEALGGPLDRFIPARFRAAHAAHVRAFGETGLTSRAMGKLGTLSGLRASGQEFPIEASISQTTVGGAKLFTVILRDITERKTAEADLSRSQEQLRALAARLQQAREEEAVRIARELHDQLGRCLTALKLDVGSLQRGLRGGLKDESARTRLLEAAERMGQALDETVQTVRRISTELRPGVLDDLGLAAAIDWQAKDFEKRSGIACVLRLPEEDPPMSREQATTLFRIFQESLTNVARHAHARTVWVYLAEEAGQVVLEVEDDGVGLSPAALAERRSLGLLGMRERAAAFGGQVEVTGSPGKGVAVTVRLPVRGTRDEGPDR